MRIVADENIPFAAEAFAALGTVILLPGKAIDADAVRDADALLVRSVTRVDAALLEGSRVRYVGTATIGTDHVDTDALRARGIAFASAPGSNATSVAEYVFAALLELGAERGFRLEGATLGIVGVGNVGGRVRDRAAALGMRLLLNDPPRARREGEAGFVSLDTLLAQSEIVTVHVPLTTEGPDRTERLCGEAFFGALRPGAIFLNTSRGRVVEEAALRAALAETRLAAAVLDVWQDEPRIDPASLRAAALGTPHIAGYSFDGKVAGTRMIYEAACTALGAEATWDPAPHLPPPDVPELRLDGNRAEEEVLRDAVSRVYPIRRDDAALREGLSDTTAMADHFTRLRKTYPRRREFRHTRLILDGGAETLRQKATDLGFTTGCAG